MQGGVEEEPWDISAWREEFKLNAGRERERESESPTDGLIIGIDSDMLVSYAYVYSLL